MHKKYKQSGKLIYFASEVPVLNNQEVQSIAFKGEEGKKLSTTELVGETNKILNKNSDRISKLPKKFQTVMRDNIAKYFNTSADRFDKNQKKGLSEVGGKNSEFGKYKAAMLQKVEKIIEKYAPANEGKKHQENQTKEALKDRENFKKSHERAEQSMKKATSQKLNNVQFDASKLGTPDGIKQEVQKIGSKSADLQKLGSALNTSIADFNKAYTSFQKGKKGWGVALRGLASPFMDDPETKKMEAMHRQLKNLLMVKVDEVRTGEKNVKKYGEEVNDAPERLKEGQLLARERNKEDIEETKENNKKNVKAQAEKRQKYTALKKQHAELALKKTDLDTYESKLQTQAKEAQQKEGKAASQIAVKSDQLTQFSSKIKNAVGIIDKALKNPNLSAQQKQQLSKQKTILEGHMAVTDSGSQNLGAVKIKQETAAQQRSAELESKLSSVGSGRTNLDTHITGVVKPALTTLDSSLAVLKNAANANKPRLDQLLEEKATIDKNIEDIDKIDATVADAVLDATLGNHQLLDGLETQERSIGSMSIDKPGLWDATGGLVFGKIGEGLSMVSYVLDEGIDWAIKQTMKISPAIGVPVAVFLNSTVGMLSGAFEGAGELVTGLNTLIGSPWQTLKGLGALAPWADNAGAAWKEMGKAMISYKEFSELKIGKGAGKVVFNVLLTLTGGGAALKGVQAGGAAARGAFAIARRTNGVILSSAKAGLSFAGRGAVGFTKELATVPGKILGGTGRLLKAPVKMIKRRGMSGLARAEDTLKGLASDAAKVTDEIDSITIAGKKASELPGIKGKTFDQLKDLTPDQLLGHGLKTPGDFVAFAKFKAALKTSEKLKKAVKTAKMSEAAEKAQVAVTQAGDELATASSKLDELEIGGRPASLIEGIKGKTLAELKAMSPDELADLGIKKGTQAMKDFKKYKTALKEVGESKSSVSVARVEKAEIDVARASDELATASSKLDEIKIGNESISKMEDIKGKTLAKLDAMSPYELAAAGIKGFRAKRAFKKYKKALKAVETANEKSVMAIAQKAVATAKNKLAVASSKMDDIRIDGVRMSQMKGIKGKTLDELRVMTPEQLEAIGINSARARRSFRQYKRVLKAKRDLIAAKVKRGEPGVLKAKEAVTRITGEHTAATSKLDGIRIEKGPISKLENIKGKSLDELEAMSSSELTAAGIKGFRAKSAFRKYKKALKAVEKLKKGVKVAKAQVKRLRILSGDIRGFKNYEGIRDIGKTLKLSIEEQLHLAKSFMESSGKHIDDMIRMEDTVGKLLSVAVGEVDDIARFMGKAEKGLQTAIDSLKRKPPISSPAQIGRILEKMPDGTEKVLLQELAADLNKMGGNSLSNIERVAILKESMRFLRDYKTAFKQGGMGKVKSSQEVFDLIRGNQRKLVHQTMIDRKFFTGSDHGTLHILKGNMRIADQIFDSMSKNGKSVSPQHKIQIRQAIIDHDLGYTIRQLEDMGTNPFRSATKDHQLFSTIWLESKRVEYTRHYGKVGYERIRAAVLDHSRVRKGKLVARGDGDFVGNVLSRVDALGATADMKMMALFDEPEMMRKLYQLEELGIRMKTSTSSAEKVAIIKRQAEVYRSMKQFVKNNYTGDLQKAYTRALKHNFDPTDVGFAATRDLGSHSAGFERIAVAADGSLNVTMSVNENLKLIRDIFGRGSRMSGDKVSTKALAKIMDDYGLTIKKGESPVATVSRDGGIAHKGPYTLQNLADDLERVELGKSKGGLDSLKIETPQGTFIFEKVEKSVAVARGLKMEKALKRAIERLRSSNPSAPGLSAKVNRMLVDVKVEGYFLDGKPAADVFDSIQTLITRGKTKEAASLLEDLRFRATKQI